MVQDTDGDADLSIYMSEADPKADGPVMKRALFKKGIVFAGPMWGQLPSLDVNGKGSLVVKSTNTGIGRTKWEQSLTVVYRDKDFVIAGITYLTYDGLDPKAGRQLRPQPPLRQGPAERQARARPVHTDRGWPTGRTISSRRPASFDPLGGSPNRRP